MATILHLKIRNGIGAVNLDRKTIAALRMAVDEKQIGLPQAQAVLWDFTQQVLGKEKVHDKFWLEMIANWVPTEKGQDGTKSRGMLPFTEQARWVELVLRIDKLDDTKTGKFTLSKSQAMLIFDRLCDPRYEMTGIRGPFAEFIKDFFVAMNKWPEDVQDDDGFDAEFEPDEETKKATAAE